MKYSLLIIGTISLLLGGLWFLQGIGAVHVRPILCFADCEPVQGASTGYAILGCIFAIAGVSMLYIARRRHIGS